MLLATLSLPGCDDDRSSGADGGDVAFINLRAEDVSSTRAVIRFGTIRPTTCETEFGQDAAALDRSATDPTMGPELYALDHQVPLEDLLPATQYYYRARATDEQGVIFRSAIQQFVTEDAPVAPMLTNFASLDQGSVLAPYSTPDPDVLYGFDLETAISARRVFVEAVTTTGGNTGAREIRLLGPTPQVPSPPARSL